MSCATTNNVKNPEKYAKANIKGDYGTVVKMVEEVSKPDIAKQIDLGMAQHFTKNFDAASQSMERATRAIDEAFTKSILSEIGAATISEGLADYSGNVYEYLLVDTFNALNYYNLGDLNSAYSRLIRVGDKQREYIVKYGELALDTDSNNKAELNKALGNANNNGFDVSNPFDYISSNIPDEPSEYNLYKTSPTADYLQIVMASINRSNLDDYIVRELNSIAPQVDTSIADGIHGNYGRIEVLALGGTISQRQEFAFYTPDVMFIPYIGYFGFKYVWPVYRDNGNKTRAIMVSLDNGESKETVLLEDFDEAVRDNVALTAYKAYNRSVIRSTTTKLTAAISAAIAVNAAYKNSGDLAALTVAIVAKPTIEALDLKEVADIRQAYAFPNNAYCTNFTVEPGTYTVTVDYSDGSQEVIKNVEVRAGKAILVESTSAWAK